MVIHKPIPKQQRALILQGGVALGAYEAGVIKTLCNEISEQIKSDDEDNDRNQNVFDIVAGTSIGAINAAILVSHVKENNGRWDGAFEKLMGFWDSISSDPSDEVDFWTRWWKEDHKDNPNAASIEEFRRYYSARFFLKKGMKGVFSEPELVYNDKFFDNSLSWPNNF